MDHPNEGFLAQLEEDMMKLVLKHGMMVSSNPVLIPPAFVSCPFFHVSGSPKLCQLPGSHC